MDKAVYIGADINNPDYSFDSKNLVSVSINTSVDLLQNEMQVDTAEITVFYEGETLKTLPWETPVWIYNGQELLGKFYSISVKRIAVNQYEIKTVSYIGFLENEKFYGGVYDRVPLPVVIEQIIRTDGLRTLNGLASLKIDRTDSDGKMGGATGDTWFDLESITNDMRNSMYCRFKIHGFHNDEYTYDGATEWFCPLVGQTAAANASTAVKETQYGVIGAWTKNSYSDPYPATTELFFRYGQQEISIGTPNVGDIIEINCEPQNGIVTINGVQHSITPKSTEVITNLEVIGGGRLIWGSGNIDYDHHVDVEWLDYHVTTYNTDETVIDFLPLLDCRTNTVYYRNGINGGQFAIPCSDPDNVTFLDVEAPGTFPHGYRDDFVDSINYSAEARNYRVNGWIPICNKREAIHKILMPSGLSLKKDADGNWLFSEPAVTIISDIETEKTFEGGSIEYSGDVNEIVLKEHNYVDRSYATAEQLFTSSEIVAEPFVAEYSKQPATVTSFPYYPEEGHLYDGALFIYAKCENAALIPGNLLEIQGTPFDVQEKVYTKKTESGTGTSVSVEDVTTITKDNSAVVMQRLENYYLKSHTCSFDIVKNKEKCGLKYSFVNPFYEEDNGFLVKCVEQLSSFSRAQCEFLCGYDPIPLDNGFNNYVILTGNGTWAVPEEVFERDTPKIRVVIIGGGDGGESGLAGYDGLTVTAGQLPPEEYTPGGEAGDPGNAGKIFDITIANPSASYSYSSGIGGTGASTTTSTSVHNVGSSGTASTFSDGVTTYTSEDGEVLASGHTNFLNGEKYAMPFALMAWNEPWAGESTYRYGSGGKSGWYTGNTIRDYQHALGQGAMLSPEYPEEEWTFTFFGHPYPDTWGHSDQTFQKGPGCGGGCGIGEQGERGGNATSSKAGDGGNGGNATWIPPKATDYNSKYYGYGGHGGGGGGAGGASGYLTSGTPGTGGKGGYGGCGGDGGDGCILIYY